METYSQKPVTLWTFGWIIVMKIIILKEFPLLWKTDHLFNRASEIIKADRLHLFLLSDGTRIDDNEYLEGLGNGTELIVCTDEQIQKLSIYFEIKRYLSPKNISHPLNTDYFIWCSK